MDQTVVDVSGVPSVKRGDEALIYSDRFDKVSINRIADRLGTIPYEITCGINKRVPRLLVD
jgi:alanine racemase